jgi:uncharacterized protein (TIGR04255 family)
MFERLGWPPRRCYESAVSPSLIYPKSPLVEAIYEVQFRDGPGWSELSLKSFAAEMARRFSGKRDRVEPIGIHFQFGPDGKLSHEQKPPAPAITRLWSPDGGELFQFSHIMCAYNLLARYQTFEAHAGDIQALYGAFIAEAKPSGVQFVGQRYINRVNLPPGEQPAKYFELYPKLPQAAGHRPFALQVVAAVFEDGEVALNLVYQGEEEGNAAYYLDVYARSTRPLPPDAETLRMWHERAHPHVRGSFEAVLTTKSRELFGRSETP